ncbi:MAG: Flp pilus assembly protein CpaB [Parvibaculaceae bacterium]|nr:Flp pilus assembly protein CpaB [Parvibaculaceae bacterium]|tara:strand:+ start:1000 stop:1833 length:834 start_codon:yes stop_codon:yes gene_type:complete
MRIGILALALVAAGLAAFLVRTLVSSDTPQQVSAPQPVEQPMAEVLVAAQTITIGQRVGKSDLSWQRWPETAVASTFITRGKQPDAQDVYAGAIARGQLAQGEPVSAAKLVSFENAGFMSALLSPGMRAISTKISPETGAGGFILPNDRVDVIVTRRFRGGSEADGGGESFRSSTILRNVRVLAIDQTFAEAEGEQVVVGKTATLEMLPEQAEAFALGEASGSISLSLRPLADLAGGSKVPETVVANGEGRSASTRSTGTVRLLRYGTEENISAGSN